MNTLDKVRLMQTSMLAGLMMSFGGVAYAQDAEEIAPGAETIDPDFLEDISDGDEVVVTGSRLKRDEFSSAAPLKVLNISESLAAGLVDTAAIVQRTSVAGGTQFDNTFTGQVTDSGPGASTVSLRGLDAERTLVLSNGRRLAPAGVRGAPTRPDLNLIPLASVERIDVLLDGASSIYGSDAVAGVINVITKREFDGVELDVFMSGTDAGGGAEFRASVATGISNDKGFIGVGAEIYERDKVTRGQRSFTPCERDIEVNPETGEVVEICQGTGFGNMFLDPLNALFGADVTGDGLGPDFGIYGFDFDNGSGFTFIPSNGQAGAPGNDIGSDWLYDERYNENSASDTFDLAQGIERYSVFVNGEYDLGGYLDTTMYFEGLYSTRSQDIFAGANQIFPSVPCSNPYIQNDPVLSQTPICTTGQAILGGTPNESLVQLVWTPYVTDQAGPINLDVTATRGVGGFRGSLENLIPTGKIQAGGEKFGINFGNFTYDAWASYDRNRGIDRQRSFNEERLFASVATARLNGAGDIICGYTDPALSDDLFGFITPETCVPLDVTAPSIYQEGRLPDDVFDYISGTEITTTTIDQTMFQASISGDVAYLPAGTVPFAMGVEYREDNIETLNSFGITSGAGTARTEGDTSGGTSLLEAFFETELPILKGAPLAEELTLSGAARWTEEENFGALWTYRVQGVYRPTDWITTSASFGTTYRAPNLREQNLAGQQAFAGAFTDPCIASTFNNLDPADQARVRANCTLQGADVDTLGIGGATSIPVVTGGTKALNAETSEGLTARFTVEQPWFDKFDLSLGVTYWDFKIENSIEEPSSGFILNECIVQSTNLDSPFCNLIQRDTTPNDPSRNFISLLDSSFVNVGLIETDGFDFDLRYGQEFAWKDKTIEVDHNASATYIMKNKRNLFNTIESFDGRVNTPHWRGDAQTRIGLDDLSVFWNVRYIGSTMDDDIDAIRANDIIDVRTGQPYVNDQGVGVFRAGFRDLEETRDRWYHDFSATYDWDTWSITTGIRNAFDVKPPLVDEGEGYPTSANVVLGGGYDVYGRSFFARVRKTF